jgi:hypothetical protein
MLARAPVQACNKEKGVPTWRAMASTGNQYISHVLYIYIYYHILSNN